MQDLHSILLSLQKEKLVDIISTLSESNINFKNQLLLLISEKNGPVENSSDNAVISDLNKAKYEIQLNCNDEFSLEPVSKKSSPQEKINLFKSLFIGREDVFALRW
ncbi:MAG: hypothetical protein SPK10_03770, partial [Treponema sp.]|nr:hypothetical protein [Treponema sp.]